jgi:hypothetical protein
VHRRVPTNYGSQVGSSVKTEVGGVGEKKGGMSGTANNVGVKGSSFKKVGPEMK